MLKLILVVYFLGLLIFTCISICFNNEKTISTKTLFNNVPFCKKIFWDKTIDKIVFNVDTNEVTVYFPSNQYTDILNFFENEWSRNDCTKGIIFSQRDFIVFLRKNIMKIHINR